MSKAKKLVVILTSIFVFSLSGLNQSQAADIAVTLGTTYNEVFPGPEGASAPNNYTLSDGSGIVISVSDCCLTGDIIRTLSNGAALGDTSTVTIGGGH